MTYRKVNGVPFVNHCTSSYRDDAADAMVERLRADPTYRDAFHVNGYVWCSPVELTVDPDGSYRWAGRA